jgi:general secretion pathway protein L
VRGFFKLRIVGIDIGSYSIKIAELENFGSNVRIVSVGEQPLSQKPGVDKDLELVTQLKDIVGRYNPSETKFVLGLPQDKISTRVLQFPFKEKFKILKSLPFELEDQIPFSASEAIFEAKVIRTFPVGSEVLAVAAPKPLIKKLLGLASDVQMNPEIISLEGFALNNLFEDLYASPPLDVSDLEESVIDDGEEVEIKEDKHHIPSHTKLQNGEAILDIGHSSSNLIVRSAGALYNIRRINWGAKNLAQAVAKEFSMQESEALQNIKASKGILLAKNDGTETDQVFSDVLSLEIANLGKILKWTLLEIQGSNGIKTQGIGLLGGLANLHNIGPKLTEQTLIACNKILKIKNYPEIDMNEPSNLSMGVAIGLGLEAFKRASNPATNFRQLEFQKDNSGLKDFWDKWGFYINLTAASIAVFFVYAFVRESLSEELALQSKSNMRASAASVFKMKKYNASTSKLDKLFKDLEKREQTKEQILQATGNAKNQPLNILKRISEKASSKMSFPVDIKNLKIEADTVVIQGETTAKAELQNFVKKLKPLAVGTVSKTERPLGGGKINFNISFKPKKTL